MSDLVKVNLGCGTHKLDGFINIDESDHCNPDLIADVLKLPFDDGYADIIYAGHILEHIRPKQIFTALREWKRVLKSGGTIYIVIPDFIKAWSLHMSRDLTWEEVNGVILGMDSFSGVGEGSWHKQLTSEEHTGPFIKLVFGNMEVMGNECEYSVAEPLWQTVFKSVKTDD
jgi:ubiquinone/menaquinone biosynthesis C-methylase UbiE